MAQALSKKETKVISVSVFEPNPAGHGGQKRTNQINDLLRSFDHHHIVQPLAYNKKVSVSLKAKIKGSKYVPAVLAASKIKPNAFRINSLLRESYNASKQDQYILKHKDIFINAAAVVWESNFPDLFYFPSLLKKEYGVKVIACPQNIEALVPNQILKWYGKTKFDFLAQEMNVLRECDEVFTISEEEQWLLNLFDISAKYLPYYPQGELYNSLLEVRKNREAGNLGDYFLIVGSVGNPPTKAGMLTLLRQLKQINGEGKYTFKVGGFGTEIFASEFGQRDGIEILGALEEAELNKLMTGCKAMIVSQGYSTGALTKMSEILISGIPVVVDAGASRSYRRMDGIYIYESPAELSDYLKADLLIPAIPPFPVSSTQRFIQAVS